MRVLRLPKGMRVKKCEAQSFLYSEKASCARSYESDHEWQVVTQRFVGVRADSIIFIILPMLTIG